MTVGHRSAKHLVRKTGLRRAIDREPGDGCSWSCLNMGDIHEIVQSMDNMMIFCMTFWGTTSEKHGEITVN